MKSIIIKHKHFNFKYLYSTNNNNFFKKKINTVNNTIIDIELNTNLLNYSFRNFFIKNLDLNIFSSWSEKQQMVFLMNEYNFIYSKELDLKNPIRNRIGDEFTHITDEEYNLHFTNLLDYNKQYSFYYRDNNFYSFDVELKFICFSFDQNEFLSLGVVSALNIFLSNYLNSEYEVF